MSDLIFGILGAGTYYSSWYDRCIASIYPICDKIVVANAGFDLSKPDKLVNDIPVKKVTEVNKQLDIENKIIETNDFSKLYGDVRNFRLCSEREARDIGITHNWWDLRGRNITLASQVAFRMGAKWVLKIDTDEVVYEDAIKLRHNPKTSTFYQYEMVNTPHRLAIPRPDSPYNDSVFMYRIHMGDYYGGGGGPHMLDEHSPKVYNPEVHAAHLRTAFPYDITDAELLDNYRNRLIYHMWAGHYVNLDDEIIQKAEGMAADKLRCFKANDEGEIFNCPPEVSLVTAKEYIETHL